MLPKRFFFNGFLEEVGAPCNYLRLDCPLFRHNLQRLFFCVEWGNGPVNFVFQRKTKRFFKVLVPSTSPPQVKWCFHRCFWRLVQTTVQNHDCLTHSTPLFTGASQCAEITAFHVYSVCWCNLRLRVRAASSRHFFFFFPSQDKWRWVLKFCWFCLGWKYPALVL